MTLDKHKLDGIPQIESKTLSAESFETLLRTAGYIRLGAAPAQGKRKKSGGGMTPTDELNQSTVLMAKSRLRPTTLIELSSFR